MPSPPRARLRALIALPLLALPATAHAADDDGATVSGLTITGRAAEADQPLSAVRTDAQDIARQVNAVTVEDTLKYLPNIFVRRRHIGDTQAPITTRTSGVGSSARSLIYADGVLLSALIGNNNSTASPRWGMVAPEEVEAVQVLYGPFSAAYAGNSIGAVVNIATRTPDHFEATAKVLGSLQAFKYDGTDADYGTYSTAVGLANRVGPLAWRLSFNRTESQGQPLAFATAARPAATSAAGTPVTGAYADINRTGQPIVVLGAGGLERQAQENAKLRLVYQATPDLSLSYMAGYFGNNTRARSDSWLRDASGATVWSGPVNIDGRAYNLVASTFSSGTYRLLERHWMQALGFDLKGPAGWAFTGTASVYDYATDEQRAPTVALPAARGGGAGTITDMSGAGWRTFDLAGRGPADGAHAFALGAHFDRYALGSDKYNTTDWLSGPRGALASASHGRTETTALWAEDRIRLAEPLDLTLGARWERWRAFDGLNYSLSPALLVSQPRLDAEKVSPKLALTWRAAPNWTLSARAGLAYRFPTVAELYQAVTTGTTLSVPNPNLKPERAISTELSAQRSFSAGYVRATVFTEGLRDALISQTAPVAPGSATLANYVQNVGATRAHGAELVAEARDLGIAGFDLQGSVTYVDAQIRKDAPLPAAVGKDLPQVPRWRATLVATWRANDRLTLTGAARYSDRVFGTIDNSDIVSHTYQGFDGYLVFDARASYRIDEHWSAALGVDNLGARDYFLFHPFPQRSVLAELRYAY